jgi:tRNA U34 5-carboxymethylaminomethyl modifying enzyme MnmG/GidA
MMPVGKFIVKNKKRLPRNTTYERNVYSPTNRVGARFTAATGQELARESHLLDLLKRPQVSYAQLAALTETVVAPEVGEQIEINAKYSGYIDRQQDEVARLRKSEEMALPDDFDYDRVQGLSNEVRLKLKTIKPATLPKQDGFRVSRLRRVVVDDLFKKTWHGQYEIGGLNSD